MLLLQRAAIRRRRDRSDFKSKDPLASGHRSGEALARDSPVIHLRVADNLAFSLGATQGEVEKAFKQRTSRQAEARAPRLAPIAIRNPRRARPAICRDKEPPSGLRPEFRICSKLMLATCSSCRKRRWRGHRARLGGAFGSKLNVYAEEGCSPGWRSSWVGR